MKAVVFAIIMCYCAGVITAQSEVMQKLKAEVQKIGAQCLQEINPPEESVAELLEHKMPTSREGKCVFFCMHKRLNMMNEDGTINKEGSVQNLEKIKDDEKVYGVMKQVLDICLKIEVDADPCVTSANYASCGFREALAMGLKAEDVGL